MSDAKVVRTKDGKSRQFAFVGFTTAGDAEEALKYYNQTFLDTSRIQVMNMSMFHGIQFDSSCVVHMKWARITNAALLSTGGTYIRQALGPSYTNDC